MKPTKVVQKSLIATWAIMILAPLLTLMDRGTGTRFAVSLAIGITGLLLMWAGLRRDSGGTELSLFWQSRLPRFLSLVILATLGVLGFCGMTKDGILDVLAILMSVFLAIWTVGRTAKTLTRSLQKILLLAFSMTFVLIIAEIIFRLPPLVAITGGNTPGMIRWQAAHYDKVMTTKNALGIRSLHLERSKPAGTTRIVALGDSFTWGDKIARTEDTWPYVVEQELRQEGDSTEVINMGHPGFTTVNEAELLHRDGWSFEPNLILLQFNLNDPLPSGPDYYREPEAWLYRTSPLSPLWDEFLDEHSYFYSFLDSKARAFQIARNFPDGYAPLYADDFPGWKAAQAALQQMGEEVRKKNVPMLVVIFPSFVPAKMDENSYPYLNLDRKIVSSVQKAGLNVLDLQPVYAQFGRPGRSWWALPCDAHPNVEANRVAGQAIVQEIKALGFKL